MSDFEMHDLASVVQQKDHNLATYGPTRLREWRQRVAEVVACEDYDLEYRQTCQVLMGDIDEAILDWQHPTKPGFAHLTAIASGEKELNAYLGFGAEV
ncbi:MAG: hypothetical protein ACYDAG_02435, partial [Chloroflexota bacterium]